MKLHPCIWGDLVKIYKANDLILAIKISLRQGSLLNSMTAEHDRATFIKAMRPHIEKLMECCTEADLPMSAIAAKRLLILFDHPRSLTEMVSGVFEENISRVAQTIADECSLHVYLSLDPSEVGMYFDPAKGWEPVIARFDKVRNNVIESAKCMALERYAAGVFHILLVAEYGVIQVAKLMTVQGDKPGWGSLKRLNDILLKPYPQRSQFEQQHSRILESIVPLATVIKDNWRHKLEHVDNQIVWIDTDFSKNVAEEIISATRGFMRKLASDLPS
jgi:hypothetical protein